MKSKDLFEKIIDNALELFVAHDKQGQVLMANYQARQELGFGEELLQQNITEIFPATTSMVESTLSDELIYDGVEREMMVYRKNRTCFRALVKAIQTEEAISPYVIMITNIADKFSLEKKIEQVKSEAEDASKIKSEFVANVTHELRTPVNGILGNTRILLEKEQDAERLRILHTIERGCNEMNNLINSILDFSKLEAGKFTLENRKFEFRNMIDYVRNTHMPKITEKGLKFFVTISPEIPEFIIGDELRIGQILNNLLSNACKFTHVGRVSLEVLKTAQDKNRIELVFMVVDTGIGIDKSDSDKLFKSFSQVDASVSRKYGGTGLGLNISKQLVELMGGNITVDSEKNKGTMFSFSIWVEIPEEEVEKTLGHIDTYQPGSFSDAIANAAGEDDVKTFGTEENLKEIKSQLSKIILCVEMDNWEKAEAFGESIKQLTSDAPKEIKTTALRLKMAVQKADYDKTTDAYEKLKELL